MNRATVKLTGRQLDVMQILWKAKKPLIASEIIKQDGELNINTVQSVLKKLMDKKFIEIAEIVYSGTVLSRSYRPILTTNEYLQAMYSDSSGSNSQASLLKNMIENELDIRVIEEIEAIIRKRKKELKGEQ